MPLESGHFSNDYRIPFTDTHATIFVFHFKTFLVRKFCNYDQKEISKYQFLRK